MEIKKGYSSSEKRVFENQQKNKIKKEVKNSNKRLLDLQKNNEKVYEIEQNRFENRMNNFNLIQQNRLETVKKKYDQTLKIIKNRFDKELRRLKESYLDSKSDVYGLKNDNFKNRVTLDTRVIDHPKHVEIEVRVPNHQANNLFTTIDMRDVKINLSRNYKDSFSNDSEDEETFMSKSQSLTKIIKVPDILSEKNISKIILDDKTIFKIKKA